VVVGTTVAVFPWFFPLVTIRLLLLTLALVLALSVKLAGVWGAAQAPINENKGLKI